MHSRIFQVSREPIEPAGYINTFDIPDHFQSGIADYVDDVDDRQAELDFLMKSFQGILEPGPEENSFCVTDESRERYFQGSYQRFREICALLQTITLGAFIGTEPGPGRKPVSLFMYELNEAYSVKYGYYIYEDDELQPLNQWLREADSDSVYYFGNVLDYHF